MEINKNFLKPTTPKAEHRGILPVLYPAKLDTSFGLSSKNLNFVFYLTLNSKKQVCPLPKKSK